MGWAPMTFAGAWHVERACHDAPNMEIVDACIRDLRASCYSTYAATELALSLSPKSTSFKQTGLIRIKHVHNATQLLNCA